MIALEILFIIDKEPITDKLSKRIAYVLTNNIIERKEISHNIKKLYNLRSDIIHGRERKVSNDQLKLVFSLVQNCIITILKMRDKLRINELEDLQEWFELQELK